MPTSLVIIGATSDRRKGGFRTSYYNRRSLSCTVVFARQGTGIQSFPVRGEVNQEPGLALSARAEALALFHASARASQSCASLRNLCSLRSGHSLRFVVLLVRCRDRTASLALRSLTSYTRDMKNLCYMPLDLHKGRAIAMSVLPTVQASGLSRHPRLLCALHSYQNPQRRR